MAAVSSFATIAGGSITLDEYLATLDRLEADQELPAEKRALIPQLLAWAEQIAPE